MKSSSPLCNNRPLLKKIYTIAKDRGVSLPIMLGISRSESRLLTDFKPYHCKSTNNPAGLKWYKQDSGSSLKGDMPTKDGCWLYEFASIEEGFIGLANTLHQGYIEYGCDTLECLSYKYVGDPNVSEKTWIRRVQYFIFYK